MAIELLLNNPDVLKMIALMAFFGFLIVCILGWYGFKYLGPKTFLALTAVLFVTFLFVGVTYAANW